MNVHFIAIGGSVMHQLAIALHQKGLHISGSDDDIFDPAKSNLQAHGLLPSTLGWHPAKIHEQLDAVILGMHAKKDNPELLKAQALGIPVYSYPAYIYEQSKNKKRIVIAGSHGKTTITSMVMHCMKYWQQDFDYLVGASLKGFPSSVKITEAADCIIIEGDEYLSSPIHRHPKIHYYHPDVAFISGIAWDHINVFPTFENYVDQFRIFTDGIAANKILIYNQEDKWVKEISESATHLQKIPYQTPTFEANEKGFIVQYKEQSVPLKIFGQHNMQNLEGARLICEQLGISDVQFFEAIQHFEGAARRLELVNENESTSIYRDFAHAPSKVAATTKALSSLHPKRELTACLELHTYSSLNKAFLPQYAHTLETANNAIVFFNQHTFDIKKLPSLSAEEVKAAFQQKDLKVFTDKNELFNHLKSINWENKDLLMMSSGNFGGINMKDIAKFVE